MCFVWRGRRRKSEDQLKDMIQEEGEGNEEHGDEKKKKEEVRKDKEEKVKEE